MDALPNADTRRGGKIPSSTGFTSSTSPKVQGQKAMNSQTGVSSDCVPKERSNGLFYVLLMVEQRRLSVFFKPRILRHICQCMMS